MCNSQPEFGFTKLGNVWLLLPSVADYPALFECTKENCLFTVREGERGLKGEGGNPALNGVASLSLIRKGGAMALKKTYDKSGKKCGVTFSLDAKAAAGAEKVWLSGDFNNWSTSETPMKKQKSGAFSVKLTLESGREYQFRYLIDGKKWENDWKADKYVPAPFSDAENSVVCV